MALKPLQNRFLDLPAELRLHIYAFVFQNLSCGLAIYGDDEVFRERLCDDKGDSSGAHHCTALLLTCRQIRREAEPVLLESGCFDIAYVGWVCRPLDGHKSLGTIASCQLLRRLTHLGGMAIYVCGPEDIAASVQSVRSLVRILNNKQIKVDEFRIRFYDMKDNAGDALVEALMGLDCESPVRVKDESEANLGWSHLGPMGFALSETVYRRFLDRFQGRDSCEY